MREILFRGKDIAGNWHYGVPLVFTEDYICMTAPHTYNKSVIPATVGQFTGLTDKNGKRIYEGDIVANAWERGVVSYGDFNCSCCDGVFGWSFGNADIRNYDNYEVIGNIHDNPELLED